MRANRYNYEEKFNAETVPKFMWKFERPGYPDYDLRYVHGRRLDRQHPAPPALKSDMLKVRKVSPLTLYPGRFT